MIKSISDVTQRQAGIIAGIGFVITLAGVIFANICGNDPGIIVPGDAAATADKIVESGGMFRIGILGWLIAIIGDVVRAWALYVFFKSVNKSIALLAAWWMLLHDAIFGFANSCLVVISELLGGSGYFAGLAIETVHPLMMMLLKMHFFGFEIGLFFFSFHLGILGLLVFSSGYVPKVFGVLLFLSFLGYLLDSVVRILLPVYPEMLWTIVMGPCLIGELALMVWLVIKGGKEPKVG